MKKTMLVLLGVSALDSAMAHTTPTNLVINGDFSKTTCQQDFCISKTQDAVQNWIPYPEIEIGYGYLYSDAFTTGSNERVLELSPNTNSCVKQVIPNVLPGCYQLKFQWGARKNQPLTDSQFQVSVNGKVQGTFLPEDYDIQTTTIPIEFKAGCQAEIKFCGILGEENSYGAFIKSVSLEQSPHYPQQPYDPQYPPQIPNYGNQHFPPVNVHIPVLTPPVIKPPHIVIPQLPEIVLPKPPIIHIPIIKPPIIKPPTIHVTPPTIHPIDFEPSELIFDFGSKPCRVRKYDLKNGGDIEVEFDYKVLTNLQVEGESAVVVLWDGTEIGKVSPANSGEKLKFPVKNTQKGCHQLSFCPSECKTGKPYQISIKNVVVYEKQCLGGWGKDIVKNGDFQDFNFNEKNCKTFPRWCVSENLPPNADPALNPVPFWIQSPQIEIGKGHVYNKNMGNSYVAELDVRRHQKSCIKQKVPLQAGKARLQFDYAGRVGINSASQKFSVRLNNDVRPFAPQNDDRNKAYETFDIISPVPAESELEFCEQGIDDGAGAVIDNVQLANWDQCATQQIVKY